MILLLPLLSVDAIFAIALFLFSTDLDVSTALMLLLVVDCCCLLLPPFLLMLLLVFDDILATTMVNGDNAAEVFPNVMREVAVCFH